MTRFLRASLLALIALSLGGIGTSSASHSLNNDIRRWPYWWHEDRCITQGWNGPTSHTYTYTYYAVDFGTAPCGSNAYNWAVRAATQGSIQCVQSDPTYPGLGVHLKISTPDGLTDIYAHKPSCEGLGGAFALQGSYVGTVGQTGGAIGVHLHYDVWSSYGVSRSYSISRTGTLWHSDTVGTTRLSNNSAAAYPCCSDPGWWYLGIAQGYLNGGGFYPVGSSAAVGSNWSPCRTANTPWVYTCSTGRVQTFKGSGNGDKAQHAVMCREYTANACQNGGTGIYLPRGTLAGYTELWNGFDWVYWLGYPINNRWWSTSCGCWKQNFEYGRIDYYPVSCNSYFYRPNYVASYTFCD